MFAVHRIVAPKREKLEAALESLRQKEEALAEAVTQLQKLRQELERLQAMYDARMKEKEDLIKLVGTIHFLIISNLIKIGMTRIMFHAISLIKKSSGITCRISLRRLDTYSTGRTNYFESSKIF